MEDKKEYVFAPGVTANMTKTDAGQFEADIMAVLKSYGFRATMEADAKYDDIKFGINHGKTPT